MAGSVERSRLWVEGEDDSHAIRHLLIRHGIDYDQNRKLWPDRFPFINAAGGKDKILNSVETTVSVSNGRSVGFVLDADSSLRDRWNAIASRLRKLDLSVPQEIPPAGFVGESPRFRARVGVWLMPDNQREGALEDFLETLVQAEDPLLPHAKESAERAKALGARYPDSKAGEAVLRTWLAWQEDPGLPYGSAIRARFFRHDSPTAESFVAWYRCLFAIDASGGEPP